MHAAPARQPASTIDEVVEQLQQRIDALPHDQVHRRAFITTYQRTTQAIGDAVRDAFFEDPDWVVRWDIAFADLFIVAHDADQAGGHVPRPWRLAFQADSKLPSIVHLLLGMNAHINYDLPPATLSVITDHDFEDPLLMTVVVVIMSASTRSWPVASPQRITRSAANAACWIGSLRPQIG